MTKIFFILWCSAVLLSGGTCPSSADSGSSLWGPAGSRPVGSNDTYLTGTYLSNHGWVWGSAAGSYRQNITSYSVHAMSTTWLTAFAGRLFSPHGVKITNGFGDSASEGFNTSYVHGNTQRRMVVRTNPSPRDSYPFYSDPGTFPIPPGIYITSDTASFSRPWDGLFVNKSVGGDGDDRQTFVIDVDNCFGYEMFKNYWDYPNFSSGLWVVWDLTAGDQQRPINFNAESVSGMSTLAGLVRQEEIHAGVIPHALGMIRPGGDTQAYMPPAAFAQCCGGWDFTAAPFGSKLRMKANWCSLSPVACAALPVECAPYITALETYGAILKDGGAPGDLNQEIAYNEPGPANGNASTGCSYNFLQVLINPTNFEFVDTGETIYCPTGEAQSGTVNVTGGNPNVTWASGDKFAPSLVGQAFTILADGGRNPNYQVISVSGCTAGFCTNLVMDQNYHLTTVSNTPVQFVNWDGIHCTTVIPTGTAPVISTPSVVNNGDGTFTLHWTQSGIVDGQGNPVRTRFVVWAQNMDATCATPSAFAGTCKFGQVIDGIAAGESATVTPPAASGTYYVTVMGQNKWGRTWVTATIVK